jgi:hypothetical protein
VTETLQTENTAPAPEEITPPGAPVISETERAGLQSGLELMAGQDEDLEKSGFAGEWRDQKDYTEGKPITPERRTNWFKRAQEASQRQVEIVNNEYGAKEANQQQSSPELRSDPSYFTGDQVAAREEQARKVGAAYVRAEQYFGGNDTEKVVQALQWHEALDPDHKVRQYYVESKVGPQMCEYLADNPEKLGELADMSPQDRHDNMKRLEGYMVARQDFAGQQPNQFSNQPRKVSLAPPVFRSPRGSAQVPQDIHQLASKDEISDYVKHESYRIPKRPNRD